MMLTASSELASSPAARLPAREKRETGDEASSELGRDMLSTEVYTEQKLPATVQI